MPFVRILLMFGMPFVLMAFGGIAVLQVRSRFPKLRHDQAELGLAIEPENFRKALQALKIQIDHGLSDVFEGRVKNFDAAQIIERGNKSQAAVLASAEPERPSWACAVARF